MKVQQFIKTLNNTEIGKGGTHEYYVLVSTKAKKIHNLFDDNNLEPSFINLKNGGKIESVHITKGGEFRINGLGEFYRLNDVNAGDEIIFERRDYGNSIEFFLNLRKNDNRILFQKNSKGFEILNPERFINHFQTNKSINAVYKGLNGVLEIEFSESGRKRSDSPTETDFYSIKFMGQNILDDIKSNEYLQLSVNSNGNKLKKVIVWQSLNFNLG